jgi:polyketide cyclase/dehydrase/lipid transport protein
MAKIERTGFAPVTPAVAARLWVDTNRWPTFVDGFGHIVEIDEAWPEPRSKVVWQSGPAGRGRVTERIREITDGAVVSDVFDTQMTAIQAVRFEPADDGSDVFLSLDYELQRGGPLRGLTDVLFIRRALAMALERTLRRFSTEAGDEATL